MIFPCLAQQLGVSRASYFEEIVDAVVRLEETKYSCDAVGRDAGGGKLKPQSEISQSEGEAVAVDEDIS
jgi:hypothetical protein